nr:PH domain-containing protein [Streptomyces sp. NBC_00974]
MGEGTLPRLYRSKPGKALMVMGLVGMALAGVLLKAWTESFPLGVKVLVTLVLTVAGAWVVYAVPRRFTGVDDEGVSLRNAGRLRRLAWGDIYDIGSVTPPAGRGQDSHIATTYAYAYLTNGRRVLLPCVDNVELGEGGVLREVAALRSLLEERREAGWTPDPQRDAEIARRQTRQDGRRRFVTSWKFAVLLLAVMPLVVVAAILLVTQLA